MSPNGALGNFLTVAAEIWRREVANVAESCMKNHRSTITYSTRLRHKMYNSDDIQFFIFMISVRGRKSSSQFKFEGAEKTLRTSVLGRGVFYVCLYSSKFSGGIFQILSL